MRKRSLRTQLSSRGVFMIERILTTYALDTNVLIHDPHSLYSFDEHTVMLPMVVLEELDKLKKGGNSVAADCREAIRNIDNVLGDADTETVQSGVSFPGAGVTATGKLSIAMQTSVQNSAPLSSDLNDNKIINQLVQLQQQYPKTNYVLVSKDINMRLKARGCGIEAQDYHNGAVVRDIESVTKGFHEFEGSFWDLIEYVETNQVGDRAVSEFKRDALPSDLELHLNQYLLDERGFVGRIISLENDMVKIWDKTRDNILKVEAWGLKPRDIHQAITMDLLLDINIDIVNLSGKAGSGKTILALASAIEQCVTSKIYKRIIVSRSVQGLDQDIGFLPGTEAEKMEPWLGAITDNLEALHEQDESMSGSIDYILQKVPLHFKSLQFVRGRSFISTLVIIDEVQNLSPHQIRTITSRIGKGSKIILLGDISQVDNPLINASTSGLTYAVENFKTYEHGGSIELQGVPRSRLAAFVGENLK